MRKLAVLVLGVAVVSAAVTQISLQQINAPLAPSLSIAESAPYVVPQPVASASVQLNVPTGFAYPCKYLEVYRNGLRIAPGAANDYTVAPDFAQIFLGTGAIMPGDTFVMVCFH